MPSFRKILLTFLLSFFFLSSAFSQEIKKGEVYNYARKIVDTMASESMHGRGYVNGGDSIAANYMKTEFQKFGLKSFTNDDYYQRFSFPVNTFPGKMEFKIIRPGDIYDYKFSGIPGRNFIVDPASSSIQTNFSIKVFDSTQCNPEAFQKFCKKIKKNDVVLFDDTKVFDKEKKEYFTKIKNIGKGKGIIELVKKLTWDQSQTISNKIYVQIPADSISIRTIYEGAKGNINLENKFISNHSAQNVIGYIQGSEHPDSFIVYTAHYDHLGQMGKDTYFPGANDNASGSAMLLNLAKYYSMPEHKPKYSIVFMAFCGEEVGLLGSRYYTEHPLFPMKNIRFLLNMDIMGTGEDGITVVNGTLFRFEFDKLKQINTENNFIKDVKMRGKAANSDHYFFAEKGVKACFIYTMGGIKAYHDIYDKAETLPLNEFENLFKLITKFNDYLQN